MRGDNESDNIPQVMVGTTGRIRSNDLISAFGVENIKLRDSGLRVNGMTIHPPASPDLTLSTDKYLSFWS